MTYITSQPYMSDSWDDICYPIGPVWLTDILPDYEIMATDRQQLVVGQPLGGRKTIFGIQSADYAIIPNEAIRQVVDQLLSDYTLQIKHTPTGEFSISIIFDRQMSVGTETLQHSLMLTNSYNGKTPFTIQGQTIPAVLDQSTRPANSLYRALCENGLMGWADSFDNLAVYRRWLNGHAMAKSGNLKKIQPAKTEGKKSGQIPKIHHSRLTPELFKEQLHNLLAGLLTPKPSLTSQVYEHFQQKNLNRADDELLKDLPIPVQLAKQAQERLRLEQRMLGSSSSYWLMYNAVNHALFTARSSLTLNDRYKLDERVFHRIAARAFA
ncbi:hypothetical protein [Dyadobacter psychrotolerans]|uniref:DUF932 domain-containing protein n=1 Tax=Dyadobacter psychrotolerans TaxID=2541721 RepID=A0A4V2Z411_9BACT|nr:hypothetical protein [Dyadobacter psychrotolerans]TDE14848.1 hypothetical protein E0F88_16850 [Dyadobacter psychrotolerans]